MVYGWWVMDLGDCCWRPAVYMMCGYRAGCWERLNLYLWMRLPGSHYLHSRWHLGGSSSSSSIRPVAHGGLGALTDVFDAIIKAPPSHTVWVIWRWHGKGRGGAVLHCFCSERERQREDIPNSISYSLFTALLFGTDLHTQVGFATF